MVRRRDQFWEHATKLNPTGFRCNFCGGEYAGSITRLKWHLAKIEGHDINVCPMVSKDIQEEAYRATRVDQSFQAIESSHRKRKIMSSSATRGVTFTVPTCSWRQNNESEHQVRDPGTTLSHTLEEEMGERITFSYAGVGSQMENNVGRLVQPVKTIGSTMLTAKFVGEACEKHLEQIWSWLMNDVLRIGIYGMGGVGKTELAKHLNNKLLEDPNKFDHVYWVNVSPNCSIHKLQNAIAMTVGIDLSGEYDENKRVARLSKELTKNKKSILILDDVWDYIPLQDVGIPLSVNECTLVLTTRSLDVCRQINCQHYIKMKTLTWKDSYDLLKKELGDEIELPQEIEDIAAVVAGRFYGLPLGIVVMARYMRGVVDIHQWRNAREGFMQRQVNNEVFEKLKLSYDYLKDPTLQRCFVYCALFPHHEIKIERGDLIEYLIDEGIIKRMNSRREELDEGHTLLNILQNVCLLDTKFPMMHFLIRSMAHKIMEESSRAHEELEELPDEESWTEDLDRVSMIWNFFEEIPSNYSPRCPNLSTLLLGYNCQLRSVGDSFFKHLHGLKVLDLSCSRIRKLPNSIIALVNLTALWLIGCEELRRVPPLTNLKALRRLNLRNSGLEEVPEDMELLTKLVYLDLHGTKIKELNPGTLAKLFRLQFLGLPWSLAVEGEDVASLKKLETMQCRFYDLEGFNTYLSVDETETEDWNLPGKYELVIGKLAQDSEQFKVRFCFDYHSPLNCEWRKTLVLYDCSIGKEGDFQYLPYDLEGLAIVKCKDARSLCDVSPLNYATKIRFLSIRICNEMECLISSSQAAPGMLKSLQYLELHSLENFCVLIHRQEPLPPQLLNYETCFSHLTSFIIVNCPTIKKLFPPYLLQQFQNLISIKVEDCATIEEIISTEQEGVIMGEYHLPKLRSFWLRNLPELKCICDRLTTCDSLRSIDVHNCPKLLMDIPVFYPIGQTFDRVKITLH